MGIEARGAKYPYVIAMSATKYINGVCNIPHSYLFTVADSDDEARGWGTRKAEETFPQQEGWTSHFAMVIPLANIDWIKKE